MPSEFHPAVTPPTLDPAASAASAFLFAGSTAGQTVRLSFPSQAIVCREGEPGDTAYLIEDGCVEVFRTTASGPERVAILSRGAMFGEVAPMDGKPRSASVRTLMPTQLVRIDWAHVSRLVDAADPVVQYLIQSLLSRVRAPSGATEDMFMTASPARAAGSVSNTALRSMTLATDLGAAIDGDQLDLYYQPIVNLRDGTVAGFEALARWHHGTLGAVSPVEFIALAERTGLVHRLGRWVIERALADWARLRPRCCAEDEREPFISVNLSAAEVMSPSTPEVIAAALARHRCPPAQLHIELTETMLVSRMDHLLDAFKRLQAVGVHIALDDFGTGYAGLDYLRTLPFSSLKIDKAFVLGMSQSERSQQIVRSALTLSRSLGMASVAEGVEDAATAMALRELGCAHAQGYHFGRPQPLQSAIATMNAG
jgi:EAL domain-containing protein (putative c-di-GMP-specific phosphodiesterase class I)/CRP-like cAMP-binding protein